MEDTATLLTIIIPHYNTPDSLRVLLRSIGEHDSVQTIVIDDHSDKEPEKLAELQNEFQNQVLFLENDPEKKGAGSARNVGLRRAEGKWLLFADADDLFLENWFESIKVYFDSEYDLVYFPPVSRNADSGGFAARHLRYRRLIEAFQLGGEGSEERLRYRFAVPWTKLIRAAMVRKNQIEFEDVRYSNDVMFSVKCGYYASSIGTDTRAIYCVNERSGSLKQDLNKEAFLLRAEADCRREDFLKRHLTKTQLDACGRMSAVSYIEKALKRGYSLKTLVQLTQMFRSHHIPLCTPDDLQNLKQTLKKSIPDDSKGKSFRWNALRWKQEILVPETMDGTLDHRYHQLRKSIRQRKQLIHEINRETIRLKGTANGKVTDCGYDSMSAVYTTIPADLDFSFEADITVNHFLKEPGPTNWEGFGIFIRDTTRRHSGTGMYYANMASIGGYYGRYNFFGRNGIRKENIGFVDNFHLYGKVNQEGGVFQSSPLHYRIGADNPRSFHLKLTRQGHVVTASMSDTLGHDLLCPERNGGSAELADTGVSIEPGSAAMNCAFLSGGNLSQDLSVGFLAAAGTEILIHKPSVSLTIIGKCQSSETLKDLNEPDKEDRFSDPIPGWDREDSDSVVMIWYASPDGTPEGDGTRESPLDISAAINKCGPNETVRLLPGQYDLKEPLLISRQNSGAPGARKHLTGARPDEGQTILDFQGTSGALRVLGDFWEIANIQITNGFGMIIEGSYNHIHNCRAFRNLETGILIRHHDNGSPRSEWPGYNLIEDCVSFENRDQSECNADGFACKVAAGPGNRFVGCVSCLNSDDGFDLYTKNRAISPVTIENCRSFLNGYKRGSTGELTKTAGNGNGFKLGGSGMYVEHKVIHSRAEGNKKDGFTSNSNPYLRLDSCEAYNNGENNIRYMYYKGAGKHLCNLTGCARGNKKTFDRAALFRSVSQKDGEKE